MDTERTEWKEPTITLTMEPRGATRQIKRPKNVLQLFEALGMLEETALVIRDGNLLTPDQPIYPGDHITVRTVTSLG